MPVSPWWKIAHAASAKVSNSVVQGFTRAANAIEVDGGLLEAHIRARRYASAADAFDWKGFRENLAGQLETRTMKAAIESATETAKRLGVDVDLDSVRRAVRTRARATARQMATESRRAVKDALRRMSREGLSPIQAASRAKQLAGLNRQQANSIVSRILSMRDDSLSPARQDAQIRRMVKRSRRNRAKLVSQHEGSTVAEDAQEVAIRAAKDEGAIKNVFQRWVSIRDKQRDPICARLHGQRVRLGQKFSDPATGKKYDKPPQPHGHCRCGRQYEFERVLLRNRVAA